MVNMEKHRWTTLCKLLNWSLPICVFLLFLLIGIGSSITTTHGMSESRLPGQFSNPFDTPTPTPTVTPSSTATPNATSTPKASPTPIVTPISLLTPTPTLIPTPVPTVIQQPMTLPTPQVQLTPDSVIFPTQTTVTATPTRTTPTSTPTSPNPTAVMRKATILKTTLTNQQLSNAREGDKALSTFMLPLSVGAPLLLASGGIFWLIRRRQMNQYKPGLLGSFDNTQPALWVSSRELDAAPHTFDYVTGASGALSVPVMPQEPHIQTQTSPLSFTLSAYTPSGLAAPLPTSLRQSIPTISSIQPERYSQEEDWFPWADDSLSLPVQSLEPRVSNKYERVLPPVAAPMAPLDTPVPSMLTSWVQPVGAQPIHPPSTKGDPLLGEAMRQAQMGLFVVLGRK